MEESYLDCHKDKGSLTLIGTITNEVLLGLAQGQRKSYLDWHKDKGSLTLDWPKDNGSLTLIGIKGSLT